MYISPYLGVFFLVFKALNKAFSAPRIYIVEAGYFARFIRLPEWAISLAATNSPINTVKLGATAPILFFKYSAKFYLYSEISITLFANVLMCISSSFNISVPIEISAASLTYYAISSGITEANSSSEKSFTLVLIPIKITACA